MLWLTIRQHRIQVLLTFAVLLALGVWMLINGLGASGLPRVDADADPRAAAVAAQDVREQIGLLGEVLDFSIMLPLLIGVFWGAPLLAREYDTGTYRLAWTQSVSRNRWLATKLGVLGLLLLLGGLALGAMTSAWLGAYGSSTALDRFSTFSMFSASGLAPAGWWVFCFAVGVAAGAALRKLLPALVLTIAVLALVMFGIIGFAREYYAPPVHIEGEQLAGRGAALGTVLVDIGTIAPDGRDLEVSESMTERAEVCPGVPRGREETACMGAAGYRDYLEYQPADRYWQFQWTEAAVLFLGAAGFGAYALRRTARTAV